MPQTEYRNEVILIKKDGNCTNTLTYARTASKLKSVFIYSMYKTF